MMDAISFTAHIPTAGFELQSGREARRNTNARLAPVSSPLLCLQALALRVRLIPPVIFTVPENHVSSRLLCF